MAMNIPEAVKRAVDSIYISIDTFSSIAQGCTFYEKGECTNPMLCTSGTKEACEWNRCPYGKE